MSEFFKALEQAERERRRPDDVEAPPPDRPKDVKKEPAPVPPPVFPKAARPWPAPVPPKRKSREGLPMLVTQVDPNSVAAEAYRTLRTNLEATLLDGTCRSIAVTSAVPGSGKSTAAANLAVVTAQAGRRVCLVDADFWRPVLHDVFSLSNTEGMRAALEGRSAFHSVARKTAIENLLVVPSGQNGAGPVQHLFTRQRLQNLREDIGGHFDLVVYDTPPVLSTSDAVNVAAVCDGVVLVVQYGSIPPSVLRRAVQQVTQVNGRILGVLLNRVNLRGGDDDSYGYYGSYHADNQGR
jgi:protein-tyrosine kinase